MKHGVIIPLIGGMAVGASRALEEKPSWAVSWNNFATNEENFKEYYKGVPFRTLDNENIPRIPAADAATIFFSVGSFIFCFSPPRRL